MASKNKKQKAHAKRRFYERCGKRLTAETENLIVNKIQNREVRLIEKESNRVKHYKVEIDGEIFKVIYDSVRKNIITIIKRDDPFNKEV